jgi:hypothetical protein
METDYSYLKKSFKNYSYKNYKKYILKIANNILKPVKGRKFKLKYYLDNFEYILKNYTKWDVIKLKYKNKKK